MKNQKIIKINFKYGYLIKKTPIYFLFIFYLFIFMNERFKKAMNHVFTHEGGYNDIKEDSGGATNYGVSLVFLKGIKKDINKDGVVDWKDIKALKKDDALEIYYLNFWKPLYDSLNEDLGIKMFDVAINCGMVMSNKFLQRALKALGSNITDDGIIGSVTLNEVKKYGEESIMNKYCEAQLNYYKAIVASKPSQVKFLAGWTNRANWRP